MDKTKEGLGPNKLFFRSLLQMYDLKRYLALTAEDSKPEDIGMLSDGILELEKDAKCYFDMMVEDGTHQLLLDDASLL